jgi:hypothetical protein
MDVVSVAADTLCIHFHCDGLQGARFRREHPQLWFSLLRMFARSGTHTLRLAHRLRCVSDPLYPRLVVSSSWLRVEPAAAHGERIG